MGTNLGDATLQEVKEMGQRRDVTAIPKLLDWMFTVGPSGSSSMTADHPCATALIQIGEPAVEPIKQKILAAPNAAQELVWLFTLEQIKGGAYIANWYKTADKIAGFPISDEHRKEIQAWALASSK